MPGVAAARTFAPDSWIQAWKRFWFDPIDPLPLGIFRACFCLTLAYFYLARQLDYLFLFSDGGALPYDVLSSRLPSKDLFPIAWRAIVEDSSFGFWAHATLLAGLIGLGIGWIGRRGAWIVFVLHLAFLDRNPIVVYGSDIVATFWLGYLCLTRSNQAFVWTPWKRRTPATNDSINTIGVRLIQLQLCIIYAYSGLEKVRGTAWWEGAAIWQALSNGQLVTLDLSMLARFPLLIAAAATATMLWEIYFPFLVWNRKLRLYCLAFGVALHAGIGILMNLPFFAMFMVMPYLFFIDPDFFRKRLALPGNEPPQRP